MSTIPQELDDRPEVRYLKRHVEENVCAAGPQKWFKLGVELLQEKDVKALEAIKHSNPELTERCSEMFKLWLNRQPEANWSNLIDALKHTDQNKLAFDIENLLSVRLTNEETDTVNQTLTADQLMLRQHHGGISQVRSDPNHRPLLTLNELKTEFSHLLMNICNILSQSSDWKKNLEACKEFCSFLKADNNANIPLFSTEEMSKIDNCEDFKQFFKIISKHISWDEHSILSEIIRVSDSEEAEEELKKCKRKMAISEALEIISSTESDPPPGFNKFIVTIDQSYEKFTGDKYKEIKKFIFDNLNVRRYVTTGYIRVLYGSLHLEWHVTTQTVPYMIKMAHKQREVFIRNCYVFMQIGEEIIIDMHTEQTVGVEKLSQKEVTPTMLSKQLDRLIKSLNPEDQVVTLSTLRKIFDNIIYYPNNDKYRRIKLANKTFSSKVWQYPAGQEFIKMAGWIVQDDHVGLTDDSLVLTTANLLKELCTLPSDQHGTIMNAALSGDTNTIEKTLNLNNVSIAGVVYFQNGSSINLLKVAVATHNMDIVNLLVKTYSFDIYIPSENNFILMFQHAPESFAIEVLKVCGTSKASFALDGFTLLHKAVMFNCSQVVHHLITKGVDVNTTDKFMRIPLHYANLFDHKEIADYLLSNGADVRARDHKGLTPLDCIGGDPGLIKMSQHIQNKQRIHMKPYSAERLYYMKLINGGTDEESAVSHTIKQFPSIKEKEDTQTQSSSNHAAIQEEIAKYINITSKSRSSGQSLLSGIA